MTWDIEAERLKARRTFKPMPIIECYECGIIVERTELTPGMIHNRLCRNCSHDRWLAYRDHYGYERGSYEVV